VFLGRGVDPAQLSARFGCGEYFELFASGRYESAACNWTILPAHELRLLDQDAADALIVGHAGVDGILFCYRAGHAGFWAHYPLEGTWKRLAGSLTEFWTGWCDGRISV